MTYIQYFRSLSQEELKSVLINLESRMQEFLAEEREEDYQSLFKLRSMVAKELSTRTQILEVG
jgi:hypothetical protein